MDPRRWNGKADLRIPCEGFLSVFPLGFSSKCCFLSSSMLEKLQQVTGHEGMCVLLMFFMAAFSRNQGICKATLTSRQKPVSRNTQLETQLKTHRQKHVARNMMLEKHHQKHVTRNMTLETRRQKRVARKKVWFSVMLK